MRLADVPPERAACGREGCADPPAEPWTAEPRTAEPWLKVRHGEGRQGEVRQHQAQRCEPDRQPESDRLPELIVRLDRSLRIVEVTPNPPRAEGLERSSLLGRSVEDLGASEPFLTGFWRCVTDVVSTRSPSHCSVGYGDAGGERRLEVAAIPHLDEAGNFDGMTTIARDVTDLQRATEELRATSEALETIMDASPLAIMLVDRNTNIQFWNRAAERLFGWSAAEVLGGPLPHVPDDERESARALLEEIFDGGEIHGVESTRRRRDGTVLDVVLYGVPRRDERGDVVGALAMTADVTVQKRLEAQVRQAQKMESIGRLAGGIAHDFNNLLLVMAGYLDVALGELGDRHPIAVDLREVRAAVDRASGLTRQLLALSRRQALQPSNLDVDAVLAGLEPLIRRTIGEDVQLEMLLPHRGGIVRADRVQVEQVILNLAVNARDAMPQGGRLTIDTGRADVEAVGGLSPLGLAPGPYVTVSVSDTGSGIAPEVKAHLFEPFFTTKPPGEGTGLGLATSEGIVRQSGGAISVDSEVGRGSVFRIYLPEVPGTAEGASASAAEPPVTRRSGRILLVEDDDAVRALCRRLLGAAGFSVVDTVDPHEAIAIFERQTEVFDLLVTDTVMPGMTGPQLARELRTRQPGLAALIMSGYPRIVASQEADLDPAWAYLAKPFTRAALVAKVTELLLRSG